MKDNQFSTTLRSLIEQYGIPSPESTPRFKSLLQDVFVDNPREMNLLITGLDDDIPGQLQAKKGTVPYEILSGQMIDRLYTNRGMDRQAAEWVVRTWAGALGYDVPTQRKGSKAKINGDSVSTPSNKKKLTGQQGERVYFPDIPDTGQKEISPKNASEKKESYTRVSEPVLKSHQSTIPARQGEPEKNTSPLMIFGIIGVLGILAVLYLLLTGGFSLLTAINSPSDAYAPSTSYPETTSFPLKKDSDTFYETDQSEDFLLIESDKDSINQGDSIFITIIGLPEHQCCIWIKGTGNMAGTSGNQPPIFTPNQRGLKQDTAGGPYNIGSYQYNGGAGKSIRQDVAFDQTYKGVRFYGEITLDSDGERTIECTTSKKTKPGTYTIRVERWGFGKYPSDELSIVVK